MYGLSINIFCADRIAEANTSGGAHLRPSHGAMCMGCNKDLSL